MRTYQIHVGRPSDALFSRLEHSGLSKVRALELAEAIAGEDAEFFARGEGPARQIGFIGRHATTWVTES